MGSGESFLAGVVSFYQTFYTVLTAVTVVMGLLMTFTGLWAFVKGRNNGGGTGIGLTSILMGVAFINLSTVINIFSATFFSSPVQVSPLSSSTAGMNNTPMIQSGLLILQMIGMLGIARGMFLLKESAYDRTKRSGGFWMVFSGTALINIATVAGWFGGLLPGAMGEFARMVSGGG